MKKTHIVVGIVSLILLLSIVQIVVSNRLSTTGIVVDKIEKEAALYQKENAILREKIYVASSYTMIASHAAELGFTDTTTDIVLTSPLPVALK